MGRTLLAVLIVLLLGACANVVIAFALVGSFKSWNASHDRRYADQWPVGVPADWPRAPETKETVASPGLRVDVWIAAPPWERQGDIQWVAMARAGIPFKSMSRRTYGVSTFDYLDSELIPLKFWREGLPPEPRPLAFAANTLIYAALPAVIWWGPGLVRLVRRRRAGVCPACGYSRDGLQVGSACPECGKGGA